MEKTTYLRMLHDLIYQANLADTDDRAEPWQDASHAHKHAQPMLDIARSLMNAREYEIFLDCFGDFDSFLSAIDREEL